MALAYGHQEAGATVFHVVSHPDLARKCELAGVDGVVAEGFEAGGHDGREELTTLALVPLVADAVSVPVIAAGGIADGRAMAAALALGAAGVQVGTRFVATDESSAHPAFKQAIVGALPEATRLVLKKGIPVRLLQNSLRERIIEAEARGADLDELLRILGEGRPRRGMFEGDLDEGELEVGMGLGLVRDVLPAGEVVRRLVSECLDTLARLPRPAPAAEGEPAPLVS
jgi:enoyl-[acyl-carrier protein] reductase II